MKGKGKKERDTEDDCPLMFIDFNSANLKDFPRLWGLLNRRDEQNVGIEDLDGLQLEIEAILTTVITRKLQLENEMESLVNWQESKAKDKKPTAKLLETTGKRSNQQQQQDDRSSKKFKESQQQSSNHLNASSSSSSGKSHAIRSKSKNVKLQEPEYNDLFTVTSQTPPPRNDLPDKFWNFVEPFCAPVKQDDVQFLEEMLKQVEVDGDLFRIPALGKEGKWSSEGDTWDRRNESRANSSAKKKGLSPYNSASLSEKNMRKTKESRQINEVDRNGYGTLTQRLVSCLMEGDLSKEENLDSELESNDKLSNANSVNILKGINLGNTDQLERRLKGVLEEQGLLDPEDSVQMDEAIGDEEDEVLHELVKCQNELKVVSAKNEATLRHLLDAAKKDLIRQEWDKKLKAADQEVMEAYKKIICAKQKKRTPTKKEKDAAFRALRERENIIKEMEGAR